MQEHLQSSRHVSIKSELNVPKSIKYTEATYRVHFVVRFERNANSALIRSESSNRGSRD